MSNLDLKLVIAIARSHNALFEKIEKNVQSFGLNTSEFGVLEMLHHKGPQAVQKVAEKILVSSGTVTYVIDKLQKKGLVERKKCDKDKRIYYVCLTEKGDILIQDIFEKHKVFLSELFQKLTEEEKDNLVKSLFYFYDSIKLE